MPTYKLECLSCHNIEEKLFTCIINFLTEDEYNRKLEWEKEERRKQAAKDHPGYELIDTTPKDEPTILCDCGGVLVILPSLCNMQPDNMWFNGKTDLGTFNSKKEYKDHIKNNNLELATRDNYESVQKKQANRFKEVTKKNKENLTKFIEREVAHNIDLPNGD